MSHQQEIICPNCGFHASHNYCAQCGQETHLHKDTFWGLVIHFAGHYFHYDSKFWKTLKALVYRPGALTVAYQKKQRMRYIPPISLYIFVSAVFFLLFFLFSATHENIANAVRDDVRPITAEKLSADSLQRAHTANMLKPAGAKRRAKGDTSNRKVLLALSRVMRDPEKSEELLSSVAHAAPKVFFFLIPFMAAFLSLLYLKRKETNFADHTIFSLHVHSFVFIILPLILIDVPEHTTNFFQEVISYIQSFLPLLVAVYFVIALRKVYGSGWLRSVFYMLLVAIGYLLTFFIFLIGYTVYLSVHIISAAASA